MVGDSGSTIQKFSRAAPWTVLARVVMAVTGVILAVVIPRHFSKSSMDYATYELLKWVVLATPFLFGLGLEKIVPRFLPELIHTGNARGVRRLLWGALGALAVALAVEAGLLLVGGAHYERSKLTDQGTNVQLGRYFWVLMCLVGLWLYRTLLYNICVARFDTRIVGLANLVSCPIWLGLTLVFLNRGYGLIGVFGAQAISVAIQLGLMLWKQYDIFLHGTVRQERGIATAPAGVRATRLKNLMVPTLISNLQFVIISLPGELLFTYVGIEGYKDTANYGLAYGLSYMAMGMFIPPIYTLAVASFSDFYVKDPDKLRKGIRYFYKLLFTLLLPIAMMGLLLGDRALVLFVGDEYAGAGPLVRVFSMYHFYGVVFIPITVALVTMERWMVMVPINCCQIALILILNYLLIPRLGVHGAMIAKFTTVLIGSVVTLWIAGRAIGGLDIPWKYLGKCILACGCSLVLYPAWKYIDSRLMLIVVVAASGLVMVFVMRWMRLIDATDAELIGRSNSPLARLTLGILTKK